MYKRQELIFGENSGLAFFLNGGLTGCVILIACLAIGLIVGLVVTPLYLLPVSYTHLDVYKRQC